MSKSVWLSLDNEGGLMCGDTSGPYPSAVEYIPKSDLDRAVGLLRDRNHRYIGWEAAVVAFLREQDNEKKGGQCDRS